MKRSGGHGFRGWSGQSALLSHKLLKTVATDRLCGRV